MEFFRITNVNTSEEDIQKQMKLQDLESFCESVFPMDSGAEVCSIGGMWGEFTLRRDEIMGGLRFSKKQAH